MSSKEQIGAIRERLLTATSFVDIFGTLPKSGEIEQKRALRRQFAALVRMVHPDFVSVELTADAEEAFRLLTGFRESANAAVERGTYHETFSAGGAPKAAPRTSGSHWTLQSATAVYAVHGEPYSEGDFSLLYRATHATGKGEDVLIKIASHPTYNALLESEAGMLGRFSGPRAVPKLKKISRFVPRVLDSFTVAGEAGTSFRAVVMPYASGQRSLTDIRSSLGRKLLAPEAAWIIRRMLGQTLAASMASVVHCAMVPDHVLVDPITHEPCHIGWLHSVDRDAPDRITMVLDRWKDFYPPEVLRKEKPDHQTDVYMAGKTAIWLLGGDVARNRIPDHVPTGIAACILQCVAKEKKGRAKDAKRVLENFTAQVRKEWGRAYRPLIMPD